MNTDSRWIFTWLLQKKYSPLRQKGTSCLHMCLYWLSFRGHMLLIVHGRAGGRRPDKEVLKKLSGSLLSGYKILSNGGTALDAIVESITLLEASGIFNAGSGGNLQFDGG